MKILAVDDEPLFLELLEVALHEQGFAEVTPVYSAKEALRELEMSKEAFDCILLDIRMPGMDGVELCRKIRSIAGYKRVPILMVTAMTDRQYIDDAFAAGASDYLTKPLDSIELRARMQMVERLIGEQSRNLLLEQRIGLMSEAADTTIRPEELEFDLDTRIMLQGFDRIIEYSALENYLLSLGMKESYGASVCAIRVTNAASIFEQASRVAFLNMLYDVGVSIETALKSSKALISYAGGGVFVAVLGDMRGPDVRVIETQIATLLHDFDDIYTVEKLPKPEIAVGPAVRKTFLIRPRGTEMLEHAISNASKLAEHEPSLKSA
ncbi:MAG: response regulator [Rhodobacterales bacterium]|nr:response regulator [Rhodobacterales bacterium]MDX5498981.1 response regulator [Rhodobacterales bacterium]